MAWMYLLAAGLLGIVWAYMGRVLAAVLIVTGLSVMKLSTAA